MVKLEGSIKEALGGISPALIKKNWEENREDVLKFLKWRGGIWITKDNLIPKYQISKCIKLLAEHTKFKMIGLDDLANLVE